VDAITIHQIAHRLHRRGVPALPRFLDGLIFLLFNSVIHHATGIGVGTRCGYRGLSVLIHRHSKIGCRVMIGAHVVIGGRSGLDPPIVDDDVYIGANACVIGNVHVGAGAIIGAGAVVLSDVPAGCTAVGNPARVLPRRVDTRNSRRSWIIPAI